MSPSLIALAPLLPITLMRVILIYQSELVKVPVEIRVYHSTDSLRETLLNKATLAESNQGSVSKLKQR